MKRRRERPAARLVVLLILAASCLLVRSFTPRTAIRLRLSQPPVTASQSPLWTRRDVARRVKPWKWGGKGLLSRSAAAVSADDDGGGAVLPDPAVLLRNEGFRIEQRQYSKFLQSAAWFSWWGQVILNVVSGVILFFAGSFQQQSSGSARVMASNGYLFAATGLGLGALSVFWTWGFTGAANRLRKSALEPPAVLAMIRRVVRTGIVINVLGLMSSLIGAEQFVGNLVAKVLSQQGLAPLVLPQGYSPQNYAAPTVQPLDIFVIQANTNTLLSHFVSLVISLVLLQRYSRLHRTLE